MHNFGQSKNKFGYVYLLTPSGVLQKASLTGQFFQRKMSEYDEVSQFESALVARLIATVRAAIALHRFATSPKNDLKVA